MASKIDVQISNLATPVLSVQISDYIEFTTKSFVTEAISSHNISPISHEDIRTFISELSADVNTLYLSADSIIIDYTNLFNELSNTLSGYAHLSGDTFYGDIFATNLTGTNTGDQDLTYLENYIEELSGNVENLNILVAEISGDIPDLTPYALQTFVTSSISEHNINEFSHIDIRNSITDVNNSLSAYSTISFVISAISAIPNPDMSQYAPISGVTFLGNIYATNLTGINTGDQDLSSYALTSDVNNLYNSLSAYALETFVTSSILEHNIALSTHVDIRDSINNVSNSLSSYALQTFVTSSISEHNISLSAHQDIRTAIDTLSANSLSSLDNKVDKVPTAPSGNFAVFNSSGNIIDSNLPLSSYLILDDLGQINQMKYMPTVYLKNKTPSLSAYCHEVWLETNLENDDIMLVIGDKILIQDIINPPGPPSGITYLFTGAIDGDFAVSGNYMPNGIPTSADFVIVNELSVNMPSTGSITCSTLTLNNNSLGIVDVYLGSFNTNYDDVITSTLITFNSGTTNNCSIQLDATFVGSALNYGQISHGEMIPIPDPLSPGFWIYPTNYGWIHDANCYWPDGDFPLGGQGGPFTYLGYPN